MDMRHMTLSSRKRDGQLPYKDMQSCTTAITKRIDLESQSIHLSFNKHVTKQISIINAIVAIN